ncbi:MAG: gamma carbonic anhydrase family protein, partial [Acinetobacter sp.]
MSKNIRSYLDHSPTIDASCYVDDMSVVIGDV